MADPRRIRELLGLGGMDAALEEERRKLAEMDRRSAEYSTGEMRSHDPSFRESMISGAGRIGDYIGAPHMRSDTANIVNEFAPGISTAASFDDAKQAAQGGRYGAAAGNAALGLLDVVPGAGALAGAGVGLASKAGRAIMGNAAEGLVPAVKAAQKKIRGIGDNGAPGDALPIERGAKPVVQLSEDMLRNATPAVNKPGFNQVSKRKLLRPYGEMTASYAPGPPLLDMPEKEFDFDSIPENSWMVGLVGDRTMGGQYLTGVNDSLFTNPVELQAGSDFLRRAYNPDDAFWASDKGVVDNYVKQIRPLQETGDDVYALTVAMAGEAGDYSRQTTNAILETIKQKPLSQEAKDAIDDAMRTPWGGKKEGSKPKFIAYSNWPGVDNITPEYLKTAGSARTKFAKLMDRGDIAALTGLDMGSIRKAITHPELRGSEAEDLATLSTGHRIAKVGPEAVRAITDPKVPHSDYAAQLAARGTEFKGGVKPIPGVAFWQDWYAKQKPGSSGSSLQRSATTQGLIQRKTPEWVDRLMAFKESEVGKRLGLTGAISAGLITASEAEEMFGYEGESVGG